MSSATWIIFVGRISTHCQNRGTGWSLSWICGCFGCLWTFCQVDFAVFYCLKRKKLTFSFESVYFGAYEWSKRRLHNPDSFIGQIGCGFFGATVASALTNPLDVVKTRLQVYLLARVYFAFMLF
jgi:hypothetical protein